MFSLNRIRLSFEKSKITFLKILSDGITLIIVCWQCGKKNVYLLVRNLTEICLVLLQLNIKFRSGNIPLLG